MLVAALADSMLQGAMYNLEHHGRLIPVVAIMDERGKVGIFALAIHNHITKEITYRIIRSKVRGAAAVITVNDSYGVDGLRASELPHVKPSEDPRRFECILMTVQGPYMREMRQLPYHRDGRTIIWGSLSVSTDFLNTLIDFSFLDF